MSQVRLKQCPRDKRVSPPSVFCVLLAAFLVSDCVDAITIVATDRSVASVSMVLTDDRVASPRIDFNVPADRVGDGTPIVGNRSVRLRASARLPRRFASTVTLVVDSSLPLFGPSERLPFSRITWTASNARVLDGRFNDGRQVLARFFSTQVVRTRFKYKYDNREPVSAGTYQGSVTYLLVAP